VVEEVKLSAIVKVDSKGRITIPQAIRSALGIERGMIMVIIGDVEKREIYLTPLTKTEGEHIYYMELLLKDQPGALAKVTNLLAERGVDIVANRCTAVVRGQEGICIIVADFSKAREDPERLREELETLDVVLQAKIKKFESTLLEEV
jgi:AbrB family looped-hinge helix DNA binding protein